MKMLRHTPLQYISLVILVNILPLQNSSTHSAIASNQNPKWDTPAITGAQASISTLWGSAPLIEEFYFVIRDFKINHQSEINNLTITVRYRYIAGILESAYPDFRFIAKDIENFLNNYPNKADYWEVLNKKLTLLVLKKYSGLATISSEIVVSPSQADPYFRSSIVTRSKSSLTKSHSRNKLHK